MSGALPLEGVVVVEYGRDLAARYAGFLLAELGCDVTALRPAGGAAWHPVLDRRKRRAEIGQPAASRAVAPADAVVSDGLVEGGARDDVIRCDVSAWGPAGPRRGERFGDALVSALAGIQTFQGSWSGRPVWLATPLACYVTGMLAALGVVAALYARRRGAPGQRLAVSALDAAFTLNCGRFVVAPGFEGSVSEQGDPHGPDPTYAGLRNGMSPHAAINAGYEKAFSAIADSNVTTADRGHRAVHVRHRPGPRLRGRVSLRIVTSMFTALIVSRALVYLLGDRKRKLDRLSIGMGY